MGRDYSYKLLASARVVEAIGESTNVDLIPRTEAVARELVPVLRDDANAVEDVWGEVVDRHGPSPTAKQVREVVASEPEHGVAPRGQSDPATLVTEIVELNRSLTDHLARSAPFQ